MFAGIPAYGWVSELSSKFAERTAQRIKHVLRLSVSSPPGVSQPYHMSPHGSPLGLPVGVFLQTMTEKNARIL